MVQLMFSQIWAATKSLWDVHGVIVVQIVAGDEDYQQLATRIQPDLVVYKTDQFQAQVVVGLRLLYDQDASACAQYAGPQTAIFTVLTHVLYHFRLILKTKVQRQLLTFQMASIRSCL